MQVSAMTEAQIKPVAAIHREAFIRQTESELWLTSCLNAWPRMLAFTAHHEQEHLGYIIWNQKSGFRQQVVLELEQLAVAKCHQGQGVATELIQASLPIIEDLLNARGASIARIMVTTREDNGAQKLYRKVLGAEVECVLKDLYSANEVVMVAREFKVTK